MRVPVLSAVLALVIASAAHAQQPDWRVFYPLKVGHRWTYLVSDASSAANPKKKDAPKKKEGDAGRRVIVEVEKQDDFLRKDAKESKESKDGKAIDEKHPSFILKATSGDKVSRDRVVIMDNGIHRASLNGIAIDPPVLFFKFGLSKTGETWEWNSKTPTSTIKGTCTIDTGKVSVPYKDREPLDALIVTFTNNKAGSDRHEITWWLVRDVGMVKQRVKLSNYEGVLELTDFTAAK